MNITRTPTTGALLRRWLGIGLPLLLAAAPTLRANDEDIEYKQHLTNMGVAPGARAEVSYKIEPDPRETLEVELQTTPQGAYDLYVGGVLRGTIDVGPSGIGQIEFRTPPDPPKPLLDFPVLNEPMEVRQGATVLFSDVFDASAGGGGGGGGGSGDGSKTKTELYMVNVGPDANAKGKVRYESKSNEVRFKVTVEQLDAGIYDLLVGGQLVTSFDTMGFHEVELDFRNPPDDNPGDDNDDDSLQYHLPLDFEPLGRQVDVMQLGTHFLSVFLSASAGDGGVQPPKNGGQSCEDLGKKKGDKLAVDLLNTGVLPGAHGVATLGQSGELELEVEIEDLPDGPYGLVVDTVMVGELVVTASNGQLNYSSEPGAGELALDFEVKGKLIEVKNGAGDTILAAVFPTSVPAALGLGIKEQRSDSKLRLNLLNAGPDLDTRGSLLRKAKTNGESLQLKAQDLPAGEYKVLVGGIQQGTLTITKDDGTGKVVFDSNAAEGGKKLPLDFTVLGALIEIANAADAVVLTAVAE